MSYPTDPTGPAANNVLDATVFQELHESLTQPELLAAVYRKFVENAAVFISELRSQDVDSRSETLHTLKGSAAMMGAKTMARLAEQMQAQGASVQVETATQQLAAELESFRAVVSDRLLALGTSLHTPP